MLSHTLLKPWSQSGMVLDLREIRITIKVVAHEYLGILIQSFIFLPPGGAVQKCGILRPRRDRQDIPGPQTGPLSAGRYTGMLGNREMKANQANRSIF